MSDDKVEITDVELELQRRKHKSSMFGTVPVHDDILKIRAAADKTELESENEKLRTENRYYSKELARLHRELNELKKGVK